MTKKVNTGGVIIGGGERVKVQSMCTHKTADIAKVTAQIADLQQAGCDIIRVSVLDEADAAAIKTIKQNINIPLVADIHFSARLAVLAIENGCDKVRLNPGNIGGREKIKLVADCIRAHHIPVRVGSNSGSVEKEYLAKYGRDERALVESALHSAAILEEFGVNDIVISVKSSSVPLTYKAYSLLASKTCYPLHIGVTEAGAYENAVIKSSVALGALLLNGIGDTIRISITGDPVREVYAAKKLLRALELDKNYVNVISCPTCGRCRWNSAELAEKVTAAVENCSKSLTIAVMGCVVNGPGEAAGADLGIAGAEDYCLIFKYGKPYRRVAKEQAETEFLKEIAQLIND